MAWFCQCPGPAHTRRQILTTERSFAQPATVLGVVRTVLDAEGGALRLDDLALLEHHRRHRLVLVVQPALAELHTVGSNRPASDDSW